MYVCIQHELTIWRSLEAGTRLIGSSTQQPRCPPTDLSCDQRTPEQQQGIHQSNT